MAYHREYHGMQRYSQRCIQISGTSSIAVVMGMHWILLFPHEQIHRFPRSSAPADNLKQKEEETSIVSTEREATK